MTHPFEPPIPPGVEHVVRRVRRNCDICDARFAGLYSVCGLAMRLRDLFKWENGLQPWVEKDSGEVLEWIGAKEELWEQIAEQDFGRIALGDHSYDPFDVTALNAVLEPEGLLYGAGYVHGLRPTFFLAAVEEKTRENGFSVYLLGRELARDLLTLPALSQGDAILLRREASRFFLWDQMFFVRQGGRAALRLALDTYGLEADDVAGLQQSFHRILTDQMSVYLHHELGELHDTVFDRETWRGILAAFPHSPIELLARAVKDLAADTGPHGTLPFILRERKTASLALYAAFLDGLRKSLFPEFLDAFKAFVPERDWACIERVIRIGHDKARHHADTLAGLYREGLEKGDLSWAANLIGERLLRPLGIAKEARSERSPEPRTEENTSHA